MVDNISFYYYTDDPDHILTIANKMLDHPTGNDPINVTGGDSINPLRPMRVKMLANNCVFVSGSIHKYWNKTDYMNDTDFSWQTFTEALLDLCSKLKIDLAKTNPTITRLEIGINYHLDFKVDAFLADLHYYKNQNFYYSRTNKRSVKKWGKEHNAVDYDIKFYNKSWLVNKDLKRMKYLEENLLRFEISYRSHLIRYLLCNTLNDLLQSKIQVEKLMVVALSNIKFKPHVDYNRISVDELMCFEALNSSDFSFNTKHLSKSIKAKIKRRYSSLLKKYDANTKTMDDVVSAIKKKIKALI